MVLEFVCLGSGEQGLNPGIGAMFYLSKLVMVFDLIGIVHGMIIYFWGP